MFDYDEIFLEGYLDALEEMGYFNEEDESFWDKHKKKIIAASLLAGTAGAGIAGHQRIKNARKELDRQMKEKGYRRVGNVYTTKATNRKKCDDDGTIVTSRAVVNAPSRFELLKKGKKNISADNLKGCFIVSRKKKDGTRKNMAYGPGDKVQYRQKDDTFYKLDKDNNWSKS